VSTAFHLRIDGQNENANAALKQYLRAYIHHKQDYGASHLATWPAAAAANEPWRATKRHVPGQRIYYSTNVTPRSLLGRALPVKVSVHKRYWGWGNGLHILGGNSGLGTSADVQSLQILCIFCDRWLHRPASPAIP